MYVPSHFVVTDRAQLIAWMGQFGFALLVSTGADGAPLATHLPLLHVDDGSAHGKLVGHVARANPHWKLFDGQAQAHSMAMFWGPHAYVSPNWYANKLNVPTWNYITIHAYGAPRIVEGQAEVLALLGDLVATYEAGSADPWSMEKLPPGYAANTSRGIVAFEMPIARLQGKAKLSQNKTAADRAGVIAALEARGGDDNTATAGAMRALDGK